MAREVPFLPPRVFASLLLLFVAAVPGGVPAQETRRSPEGQEAVEAKARLLQELDAQVEQRRLVLAREEEALEALRRALEAARQALVEERDRLAALKRDVEADIARRQRQVDERLAQIAKVYGAMKPKEAAEALAGMEDDMAVSILERLPGRSVSKIFDLMAKPRVRELTRRLEEGRAAGKGAPR